MKKIIHSHDFITMPWKNGGGTTREIFRHPQIGEWNFRISIAQVNDSGPFSIFNGFMRHLILLTGNGMILHSLEETHVMDMPLIPYTFSGELNIEAKLIAGPNTDFNVFWNKDLYHCDIEIAKTDITKMISAHKNEFYFIYSLTDDHCLYFHDHKEQQKITANSIIVHIFAK